ncbi:MULTISPECIES: helix-turn-helix domain-containing protein [Acinetobacter calcoaceticus/baumannii complex]|uniref:helix-turn-helix domain-containing protein n=1 Tax=Acinetobacter calcoaceticus/baumannii complex TaxID=909768 RepID=UPI0021D02F1C|nr:MULTISPECIES: helix-turn-helix domain-containing protein [Acinetobacter calcoaceticus/baumannii complex]EKT8144807.1 helix-turn-helix domain-containing protein [Acinetobacter baumannii]EKU7083138.1 helix-turn-helix domain-containing protein [Acinetobacter baumannii]EKV1040564.1 helix-turn-helix domain-containing protein [Acinetobacter baumannii]EKV1044293.1 helix-turn-helix domain-containing protein [Acinetobacter baumannii]EKV1917753.1 helix-turn-helix domain-containing protein [Acinetobac
MKKITKNSDKQILLTTKQAAELLGIQQQTMRRWAIYENGPLIPIRYGRFIRWSKKELLKFARES